jgi:hypothetical protein
VQQRGAVFIISRGRIDNALGRKCCVACRFHRRKLLHGQLEPVNLA